MESLGTWLPIPDPICQSCNICSDILNGIAVQSQDNILWITFFCLLQQNLKDFTFNIVGKLSPRITSATKAVHEHSKVIPSHKTKIAVTWIWEGLPPSQTIIQNRIFSLKHDNTIKPSLRKEITSMVIHNITTFFH